MYILSKQKNKNEKRRAIFMWTFFNLLFLLFFMFSEGCYDK